MVQPSNMVLVKRILKGLDIKHSKTILITDDVSNRNSKDLFLNFLKNFVAEHGFVRVVFFIIDGSVFNQNDLDIIRNEVFGSEFHDFRLDIEKVFSKLSAADFCDKETLFIVDDLQPLLVNFEMTKVLKYFYGLSSTSNKLLLRSSTDFIDQVNLTKLLNISNLSINILRKFSSLEWKISTASSSASNQKMMNLITRVRLKTNQNRIVSDVLASGVSRNDKGRVQVLVENVEKISHLEKMMIEEDLKDTNLQENFSERTTNLKPKNESNKENIKPSISKAVEKQTTPLSTFNMNVNKDDELARQQVQFSYMNVASVDNEVGNDNEGEGCIEYVPDSEDDFDDSDPDDDLDF